MEENKVKTITIKIEPVSFEILNEELEMSKSSFIRTIAMLRGLL